MEQSVESQIADAPLPVNSLLIPDSLSEIMATINQTDHPYPDHYTVHELFERQAAAVPDKIALIFQDLTLTFRQLNQQANQLAHYLIGAGLKAEDRVGISLPRSPEMIVSLLAIIKAGGVYVPLDPNYPADRLAFMAENAQIVQLITRQSILKQFDGSLSKNTAVLTLDEIDGEIAGQPDTNPHNQLNPDSGFYIVYTSGSTGVPKGVLGHHRGAVNRFNWMWEQYPFSPDEICCQKTTLNFVDAVWEIWGPLLQGVPLLLVSEESFSDMHTLVKLLGEYNVTRLVLVPSLLQTMLDRVPNLGQQLPELTIWTTSGEALSVTLYQRFRQAFPEATLLNIYGSSEVAADATCFEVRSDLVDQSVSIGRPIHNMQVYILDEGLHPVADGQSGELYVGGVGLAHGYVSRDDLTAERFIPNPFSKEPHARIYRTGDIARLNSEGWIEYLGRVDNQVKIRGIRIELSEIEAALETHPAVAQAIVTVVEKEAENKLLAAYWKLVPGVPAPSSVDLRQYLHTRLPAAMVPNYLMPLDQFPLTPNGKINRRALPYPQPDAGGEMVRPRTALEKRLANIWQALLNVSEISVYDDFFDLGGQSILAVQMFRQIREQLDVELDLPVLFETSTIASLAAFVEQVSHREPSTPSTRLEKMRYLMPIHQGSGDNLPFFCVHGGGGNILFMREWVKYLADQPLFGFQMKGIDGLSEPHRSFEEMAAAYIEEIRQIQPHGPYQIGGYSGGGVVALEIASQLLQAGEAVDKIVMIDTLHPAVRGQRTALADHIEDFLQNPVDFVKQKVEERIIDKLPRQIEGLRLKVANHSKPIPIELRDKFLTDHFVAMSDAYRLKPINRPVILLAASEIWPMYAYAGPSLGWDGQISDLEIHPVPGDHNTVIREPNLPILIERLLTVLSDA
ncbi:MAG: amino acid adenylation domain-containing protein [Ardenticatenaceae bacterium]|nr:amino acid adenylation domain-containing protein [Ardenticatenaceae bacterium]